ncbi:MAG: group I intron-associated PD-(D/E)XK endonuclease [Ktedonobacteraceae bacterium]
MVLLGGVRRDTNRIGEISESAIITRFLQLGYVVLIPYGGNQRYDLVIEDAGGHFWRIQCKTGRIDEESTAIRFSTSIRNVTGKNKQSRNYRGQCDYFAIYNETLNKVYLVPVDQVGTTSGVLRLTIRKNNQEKNTFWAKDYES